MNLLLDQIDHAVASGAIYPAVLAALNVPDIAGAVEYGFEAAHGERYTKWMDAYFFPRYARYSGIHGFDSMCFYAARCVFLHESKNTVSAAHTARHSALALQKTAILFNCDPSISLHLTTSWNPPKPGSKSILDGIVFCKEITDTARYWLTTKAGNAQAQAALGKMVSISTNGAVKIIDGKPAVVHSSLLIG